MSEREGEREISIGIFSQNSSGLFCLHFSEMALAAKFPYQRLIHEGGLLEADDDDHDYRRRVNVVKSRSWFKLRRLNIKRRFKLKVPRLRRLILRKKFRVVTAVRLSCAKVVKRFKESQAHFGDLFAGNYLFLQINPASMKSIQKYSCQAKQLNLHGLPVSYSLPRTG